MRDSESTLPRTAMKVEKGSAEIHSADMLVSAELDGRQDAGAPLSYFAAISPFSFIISSVISAAAYMSFTSSHSLTV